MEGADVLALVVVVVFVLLVLDGRSSPPWIETVESIDGVGDDAVRLH
jgi:hypothetical protein